MSERKPTVFKELMNQVRKDRKHNTWDYLPLVTLAHVTHMKTGRVAFSLMELPQDKILDELVDIANYAERMYERILKEGVRHI